MLVLGSDEKDELLVSEKLVHTYHSRNYIVNSVHFECHTKLKVIVNQDFQHLVVCALCVLR